MSDFFFREKKIFFAHTEMIHGDSFADPPPHNKQTIRKNQVNPRDRPLNWQHPNHHHKKEKKSKIKTKTKRPRYASLALTGGFNLRGAGPGGAGPGESQSQRGVTGRVRPSGFPGVRGVINLFLVGIGPRPR